MNIFETVNKLEFDRILNAVDLKKAKDGKSYICPECGNGSGRKGDGIRPTMYHGLQIWHCYTCDMHATNSDLIGTAYGITDKAELARRLEELFPELVESNFFLNGTSSKQSAEKVPSKEMPTAAEPTKPPKDYEASGFYSKCRKRLHGLLEKHGGKYRGLTEETLVEAGAGYADNFMSGQYLILPYDKNRWFARKIAGVDDLPDKVYTKGAARQMYVASPLKAGITGTCSTADGKTIETYAINIATESELDTLTIKQVGGKYIDGVVALGGAGRVRGFVEELNAKFADADIKPLFLYAADNDLGGIKAAAEFVETMRAAGYPAESFFFADRVGQYKDAVGNLIREVGKVDANSYLQEHGDAALFEFLVEQIELKGQSLYAQAAKFRKSAKQNAPESDLGNRQTFADLKSENESREPKIKNVFDFVDSESAAPMTPPDTEEPLPETESPSSLTGSLESVASEPPKKNSVAERLGIKSFTAAEYFGEPFERDFARLEKYSDRLSGFELLDEKQCWLPGLYVVGAQPGAGKTSLIWQLLSQFADRGEVSVFCSYELSAAELFSKSITRELRRKKFAGEDVTLMSSASLRLGGRRNNDVMALRKKFQSSAWARRFKYFDLGGDKIVKLSDLITLLTAEAKLTDKPPIFAIDYLQLIPVENNKATAKERVDEIMLRLKTFQKSVDAIIFLISSLSRSGYQSAKKGGAADDDDLSVFKESGMIEFSSDVIWKLKTGYKPASADLPRIVALTCSKNRHGATYRTGFEYYPDSDYFRNCELKPKQEVSKENLPPKDKAGNAR